MAEFARYLPAIIWILLLSFVLTRHLKVYRLYDSQLKIVRQIEREGGMEDGSTLVAVNQRVRYVIRMGLAISGILIGIGGIYGVYKPDFGRSVVFGLTVLAYFYGSEIATGYLTIRDERVIARILEIDNRSRTSATERNTEATDRNTAAMIRTSDADDARDIRDAATLVANTEATEGNTNAITKNTQSRDEGAVTKANTEATSGNTTAVNKNTEAHDGV